LNPRPILVTGGAGFIGSHLLEALRRRDRAVVCLDSFNDYYDPEIKRRNIAHHHGQAGFRLVEGDIRDRGLLRAVFRQEEFGQVVHLAAQVGVRASVQDPVLYHEVNVAGTLHLLEACREFDVPQMIFGSSSSVYGADSPSPFREAGAGLDPLSPYAATKRAGEHLCYGHHQLHGIAVTCLRFFSVYGPRQRPEMAIHKFARHMLRGEEIPLFGDGTSRRDYTYVDDIVAGIVAALERRFDFEIINLGDSSPIALNDLIELLERHLGRPARRRQLPDQPGDMPATCADIAKAEQLLGYRVSTPLEEGIKRFAAWAKERYTTG